MSLFARFAHLYGALAIAQTNFLGEQAFRALWLHSGRAKAALRGNGAAGARLPSLSDRASGIRD